MDNLSTDIPYKLQPSRCAHFILLDRALGLHCIFPDKHMHWLLLLISFLNSESVKQASQHQVTEAVTLGQLSIMSVRVTRTCSVLFHSEPIKVYLLFNIGLENLRSSTSQ